MFFPVTKLFQFPLFSDSKQYSHVAKPPPPAPALTDTTAVAMPACTLALTRARLRFPGLGRVPGVRATRADIWFTNACTLKINQSKDCIFLA